MKYSENAINVMAARIYKGIGRAWIVKNLSTPKPEEAIVKLLNESSKSGDAITIEDFNKKKSILRRILSESAGAIDGVVAIGDDDFPAHRGSVKNSERPIFLFYKGDLSLLSIKNNNIAVIGLLNPTQEIEITERKLVSGLVENGAVIVSGLALGCDSIAHLQTLDSNGKTVAILPSPLNDIMPAKNKDLAKDIVANGGLLISEYLTAPKSKMELSGRYQERDRLQALFSNSIVLSASYAKNDLGNDSGSRLAMGYAKDYSIPRAVIYDQELHLSNPMFDLNRQIIQEEPTVVVFNERNSMLALPKFSIYPSCCSAKPCSAKHDLMWRQNRITIHSSRRRFAARLNSGVGRQRGTMATLYSIGYGNRSWEEVQGLLSVRGCEFLIDVRSNPFSKFNPSFGKDSLVDLCRESGMRYVFMGDTLGGKPVSDEHFDIDGKVNYIRLSEGVDFQHGLSRLITANNKGICACIMCSELRPQECHRCKLIGSELKELGVDLIHIDEAGVDISQDEAIRRITGGQDDIFGPPPVVTRSRGVYKK